MKNSRDFGAIACQAIFPGVPLPLAPVDRHGGTCANGARGQRRRERRWPRNTRSGPGRRLSWRPSNRTAPESQPIALASARSSASVPCTLGAMTLGHARASLNGVRPTAGCPAAWITPSRRPSARACPAHPSASGRSATSAASTSTPPPSCSIRCTRRACRALSPRAADEHQPRLIARARCSAMASPMPPRPPVIKYTPPFRNRTAGCSERRYRSGNQALAPARSPAQRDHLAALVRQQLRQQRFVERRVLCRSQAQVDARAAHLRVFLRNDLVRTEQRGARWLNAVLFVENIMYTTRDDVDAERTDGHVAIRLNQGQQAVETTLQCGLHVLEGRRLTFGRRSDVPQVDDARGHAAIGIQRAQQPFVVGALVGSDGVGDQATGRELSSEARPGQHQADRVTSRRKPCGDPIARSRGIHKDEPAFAALSQHGFRNRRTRRKSLPRRREKPVANVVDARFLRLQHGLDSATGRSTRLQPETLAFERIAGQGASLSALVAVEAAPVNGDAGQRHARHCLQQKRGIRLRLVRVA